MKSVDVMEILRVKMLNELFNFGIKWLGYVKFIYKVFFYYYVDSNIGI